MTTNVTPPRAGVPIGTLHIDGRQVEVEVHPEYLRFFYTLHLRQGGVVGQSTTDLETSQFEDAGIAEMQAELFAMRDAISQAQAAAVSAQGSDGDLVAELRDEIRELRVKLEGMEQS